MVKTPKGAVRKNIIHIKEAPMPGPQETPKSPAALQASARPNVVLRITTKPPSLQPRVQTTDEPSGSSQAP